ncbi:hypothetical protein LP419_38955 [Massilia sp. H-1]|nr:hypothetical protein LP419_38955 [Massilia sp. H-1]
MDKPPRSTPPDRHAPDAAGRPWRLSGGRLAIAFVLAVAGVTALLVLWTPSWTGGPAAPASMAVTPPPQHAAGVTASGLPPPAPHAPPEGDADPTRDLSSYVARGEKPTMAEVIERLHQRGIHSGLGAFSPPGTSPPLVGLAVPDDFPLPKGYVRHHQSTDDGQPIEAILMFAPDFQLVDANNRPIPMPDNRVVPPELAPPGLPPRRVVIPPPVHTPGGGS